MSTTRTVGDSALALKIGQAVIAIIDDERAQPQPPVRGKIGETFVADTLRDLGQITAQTAGHSGDIILRAGTISVLVEVKNYSKNVPSTEVEKFHRDISEMVCDAAMIVSIASPITGKLAMQFDTPTLIPTIYLHSDDANVISQCARMLIASARFAQHCKSQFTEIASISHKIASSAEMIAKSRERLTAHIGDSAQTCAKIAAQLSSAEFRLRDASDAAAGIALERSTVGDNLTARMRSLVDEILAAIPGTTACAGKKNDSR